MKFSMVFVLALAAMPLRAAAQDAGQPPTEPPPTRQPAAPAPAAPQPPAPDAPATPSDARAAQVDRAVEIAGRPRPILRVGDDYFLPASDVVREATVILGDGDIQGHVERDVVVVLGSVRLAASAAIDGSLVVVGGSVTAAQGAQVARDLVVVGGSMDGPPDLGSRGSQVVIGPRMLGGRLERFVPWMTRGLLWGRPIVPSLPWVWAVVALFFLVYLGLNLIFDSAVAACTRTLSARPLSAFVVGLLVLLLFGPVSLLLTVSVIGIAVVPLLLCTLLAAWIVGKVGVLRWIGTTVVRRGGDETGRGDEAARGAADNGANAGNAGNGDSGRGQARLASAVAFTLGFVLISVAYMIPALGLLAWALIGVSGLGAATLAFISSYRQENPIPARPAPIADDRRTAVWPTGPAPTGMSVAMPAGTAERSDEMPVMPETAAAATPAEPVPAPSDAALLPRASFRDRLAAAILDLILVLIGSQLINPLRGENGVFLLLLAYHIGFLTWKGTTVGGIICQLRVVRVDGTPLRFVDALVRGLSSLFSIAVLGLGFFWILQDPDRQAWHDKIAGTYVVKVPRNWPL